MLHSVKELETDLFNAREEARKYKVDRDGLTRELDERTAQSNRVEADLMAEVMRLKSGIVKSNETALTSQSEQMDAQRLARERELSLIGQCERYKQDMSGQEAKSHAENQALVRQASLTEERRLKASQEFEDMVSQQARMSDKWRDETKGNEKRFERTVRELKDDNSQLRARMEELNMQMAHAVGERSVAVQASEDTLHELKQALGRAENCERAASEMQRNLTNMLEDKGKLLGQNAELENRAEQLGLERDRAARACEAAIARLSDNASQFGAAQVMGLSEDDAQKMRDAETLIASLMAKCVTLKKGKEKLKKKVLKLTGGKENSE